MNLQIIENTIEQKAFAYLGSDLPEREELDHEMALYLTRNCPIIPLRREYFVKYSKIKEELLNGKL